MRGQMLWGEQARRLLYVAQATSLVRLSAKSERAGTLRQHPRGGIPTAADRASAAQLAEDISPRSAIIVYIRQDDNSFEKRLRGKQDSEQEQPYVDP